MKAEPQPLVIFDLDGTLFETAITFSDAVCLAASDTGLPSPDTVRAKTLLGHTAEDFCSLLYPTLGERESLRFRERLRVREREAIARAGRLFAGVNHLLNELVERGFTLGICSNGSREYIDLVLSSCNVDRMFAFVEGHEEGRSKSVAMNELLTDASPEWAIVVGDHELDIAAATDNALPCIGVSYGYGGKDVEKAEFVADNPSEVLHHIVRSAIYARIQRELSDLATGGAIILGVNGIDTSGKTVFADGLSTFLRAGGCDTQLIHLDDFHNRRSIRTSGDNEISAYIEHAFDLDTLITHLLEPIRRGEIIDRELTLLDLDSDSYSNRQHYRVMENTIMIVEGVLLYRHPLAEYFDYRVFLDVGFDEVVRRAMKRDVPRFGPSIIDKYKRKYLPIQKWYLEQYDPVASSHLAIDNNDFLMPVVR